MMKLNSANISALGNCKQVRGACGGRQHKAGCPVFFIFSLFTWLLIYGEGLYKRNTNGNSAQVLIPFENIENSVCVYILKIDSWR